MDGQRASEVKITILIRKNSSKIFHYIGSVVILQYLSFSSSILSPPSLQVSPSCSVPPVGRGRSQEGAAHSGHPGSAGGLPVTVLDVPQGEKWGGVNQGSQHGDGLLSPA